MYFVLHGLWYFIFHVFVAALLLVAHSCFHFSDSCIFLQAEFRHIACCRILKRHLQSFSGCDCLAFVVFTFGMSVLLFPDFMHDILLMPLNSSRICCIFSCRCVLLAHLMHFLIILLNSFNLCFSPFAVSPLLNESSDLISFIDLFIDVFLRLRHNISSLCFSLAAAAFSSLRLRVAAATMLASSSRSSAATAPTKILSSAWSNSVDSANEQVRCCCGFHNNSHFVVLGFGGCGVCVSVFTRMVYCLSYRTRSSRSHRHCSCGVGVFVPAR